LPPNLHIIKVVYVLYSTIMNTGDMEVDLDQIESSNPNLANKNKKRPITGNDDANSLNSKMSKPNKNSFASQNTFLTTTSKPDKHSTSLNTVLAFLSHSQQSLKMHMSAPNVKDRELAIQNFLSTFKDIITNAWPNSSEQITRDDIQEIVNGSIDKKTLLPFLLTSYES